MKSPLQAAVRRGVTYVTRTPANSIVVSELSLRTELPRSESLPSLAAASWSCHLQHAVHPEPAHKGIEPTGARSFLRVHPEAMATLFIKMEFDGPLRGLPAIDEPVTAIREERVVGS